MNKYEKAIYGLKFIDDPVNKFIEWKKRINILQELVERDKNGIYISKEKATELLEALEELGNIRKENVLARHYRKSYNKLYKALDWSDE